MRGIEKYLKQVFGFNTCRYDQYLKKERKVKVLRKKPVKPPRKLGRNEKDAKKLNKYEQINLDKAIAKLKKPRPQKSIKHLDKNHVFDFDLNPHLLRGPSRFMYLDEYKDFYFDLVEEYLKYDQFHKIEELIGYDFTMNIRKRVNGKMVIPVKYYTDEDPEYIYMQNHLDVAEELPGK